MKRAFFIIAVIPFLFACNQQAKEKADTTENLIVPGKSIGTFAIGSSADSLIKVLGKPDRSDAAMGSMLNTWYAKHDTAAARTSLFSTREMGTPDDSVSRIKKIIVTSPDFKTKEGLTVGASLAEIGKYYGVRSTGTYKEKGKAYVSYSDLEKGIGFEVDSETRKSVAINVFKVEDASVAYMNIH
ncbi:MAG: hypothetical protein EOP46_10235 [Sphingobacteriaceae bacterium]|nr:MAG: hypothetical protein EOP46_10235 [Sphingobacteriaceae bacterium]